MSEISTSTMLELLAEKTPGKIYIYHKSVIKISKSDSHGYEDHFTVDHFTSSGTYLEYDTVDELVADLEADFGTGWRNFCYQDAFVGQNDISPEHRGIDEDQSYGPFVSGEETMGYFFRPSDLDLILHHQSEDQVEEPVETEPCTETQPTLASWYSMLIR